MALASDWMTKSSAKMFRQPILSAVFRQKPSSPAIMQQCRTLRSWQSTGSMPSRLGVFMQSSIRCSSVTKRLESGTSVQ